MPIICTACMIIMKMMRLSAFMHVCFKLKIYKFIQAYSCQMGQLTNYILNSKGETPLNNVTAFYIYNCMHMHTAKPIKKSLACRIKICVILYNFVSIMHKNSV